MKELQKFMSDWSLFKFLKFESQILATKAHSKDSREIFNFLLLGYL